MIDIEKILDERNARTDELYWRQFMLYLYVTDKGFFQTKREPSLQELSMMKAGSLKIFCFDNGFSGSEFELVIDRGLTEKIEVIE